MRRFRLADLAKTDLAEIRRYIAKDNPAAARRVIAGLFNRFRLLARHPELGERHPEFGSQARTFAAGNLVIIYRPTDRGVEISRVVSGYRDLTALF